MNSSTLRQHKQLWALALVLALLLLTAWGQVHRVLHSGATTWSSDSASKAVAPALVDEDGGSLCQLLDHLSHGAGPVQVVALAFAAVQSAVLPWSRVERVHLAQNRRFDARAPPAFL